MRAAALLTLVLLASCGAPRPTAAASPSPSPARPAASPSSSAREAPRRVVVDWAATRAVDVPDGLLGGASHPYRGFQSPDGSRLYAGDQVVTIGGEPVGDVARAGKTHWFWADDSRHLCAVYLDSPTPPDNSVRTATGLYETLPGSAPAMIAQAGYLLSQSGPFLLGCSFGGGTATVGESCVNSLCEAWTVDLLSHRILSHLTFSPGTSVLQGAVSPDGTLLAVSDSSGSTIYRTAAGMVVTTLAGSSVVAFTADDRAVLATRSSGPAQLLDLAGRELASLPGPKVQGALPEPGGTRMAVALGDPAADSSGYAGPADLVVVGEDGQVTPLAQGVLPQF